MRAREILKFGFPNSYFSKLFMNKTTTTPSFRKKHPPLKQGASDWKDI